MTLTVKKTDLSTELLTASGENTIMLTSTVPTDMQIFIKKSIGDRKKIGRVVHIPATVGESRSRI